MWFLKRPLNGFYNTLDPHQSHAHAGQTALVLTFDRSFSVLFGVRLSILDLKNFREAFVTCFFVDCF